MLALAQYTEIKRYILVVIEQERRTINCDPDKRAEYANAGHVQYDIDVSVFGDNLRKTL